MANLLIFGRAKENCINDLFTKGVCLVKKKYFYGRNLFITRVNKGLDTKQLAEMVGITNKHLNNIELEKVKPSIQTIVMLAKALDVPVEVFFE